MHPILETQNFFFRQMAKSSFDQQGILATALGIDNPYLNMVLHTDMADDALPTLIPEVVAFFAAYNVPWLWQVSPFSRPAGLKDMLPAHGLTYQESYAVMGRKCTEALPAFSLPEGYIREVLCSQDFDDWSAVLQEGFASTAEQIAQFRMLTEKIPYGGQHPFHHYVLYVDQEPVAAATLSLSKAGARLDNIAVKINEQKKGFGKAITQYVLQEAKRFGAAHCFLDSSSDGTALYKKLGFQECYRCALYGLAREGTFILGSKTATFLLQNCPSP